MDFSIPCWFLEKQLLRWRQELRTSMTCWNEGWCKSNFPHSDFVEKFGDASIIVLAHFDELPVLTVGSAAWHETHVKEQEVNKRWSQVANKLSCHGSRQYEVQIFNRSQSWSNSHFKLQWISRLASVNDVTITSSQRRNRDLCDLIGPRVLFFVEAWKVVPHCTINTNFSHPSLTQEDTRISATEKGGNRMRVKKIYSVDTFRQILRYLIQEWAVIHPGDLFDCSIDLHSNQCVLSLYICSFWGFTVEFAWNWGFLCFAKDTLGVDIFRFHFKLASS
jgi:hypothetical protein